MIALLLFWLSALLLFYTYFGFALLLIIRAKLSPRPYQTDDIQPSVSVLIAAHNEAAHIQERLENILQLDYPQDQIQVIVASDGSEDETNDIVRQYENESIKLIDLPRGGKDVALNASVPYATGDILVFTDANTHFTDSVIRNLVRPFADKTVGGVAGDQKYIKEDTVEGNTGERVYWNFDRFLKKMESDGGNVISGTGAIYAIRRSLYRQIPKGVMDDFFISTSVIAQGYRFVFAEDAIALEHVTQSQKGEFQRKVRNTTRGLYGVLANRILLNPLKHGFYALQLFTHKVLRRLMFIPLIIIFFSNILLTGNGEFYQLAMLAQVIFYGLALVGWLLERRGIALPKMLSIPTYVCLVYWAALIASWYVVRGHRILYWSTEREKTA